MGHEVLARLHDLSAIFLSIILQSLPFILVGVLAAALAEVYVSDRVVARWMPRRRLPAVLVGSLFGLLVPVCDCGSIPFARRLVAKGVPTYAGVSFILAAPVVNPVVALSTAVAFQGNWGVVALRLFMSLSVAITVSLVASVLFQQRGGLADDMPSSAHEAGLSDPLADRKRLGRLSLFLSHATSEFFDVIFFITLGAFLTAATQTFVSRPMLNVVGGDRMLSVVTMMPLATILSNCSEADAFVARAFAGSFTLGSVLAFMVIGQVVDLRNGFLLFRTLRAPYLLLIVAVSYVLVFLEALLINVSGLRL